MTKTVSVFVLVLTLGRARADAPDPLSEMRAAAREQADRIPSSPPLLPSVIARQPTEERIGHHLGQSVSEAAHRAAVEAAQDAARSASGGGPMPQSGPSTDAKRRNDDADENDRGSAAAAHGRAVRNAKGKPTAAPWKP